MKSLHPSLVLLVTGLVTTAEAQRPVRGLIEPDEGASSTVERGYFHSHDGAPFDPRRLSHRTRAGHRNDGRKTC